MESIGNEIGHKIDASCLFNFFSTSYLFLHPHHSQIIFFMRLNLYTYFCNKRASKKKKINSGSYLIKHAWWCFCWNPQRNRMNTSRTSEWVSVGVQDRDYECKFTYSIFFCFFFFNARINKQTAATKKIDVKKVAKNCQSCA